MHLRVTLFASLRAAAQAEGCAVMLPPGARGLEAKAALLERFPQLRGLVESARLAVNQEYQPWEVVLHEGDDLALIPPVSGG